MTRLVKTVGLLILTIAISAQGLQAQSNPLAPFDKLVGGTWLVDGTWPDGSKFKQEFFFESSLGGKLIKVQTMGTIDPKTKAYGLRNEGLRSWNPQDSTIMFWEFDVFGGLTRGLVTINDADFHYDYQYENMNLRDSWIFVNEDEYQLVISSVKDGKVDQVYQKSQIKRVR